MEPLSLESLLIKRIEKMEKNLIDLVDNKGINDPETIAYSQKIDHFLNLYRRHFANKK